MFILIAPSGKSKPNSNLVKVNQLSDILLSCECSRKTEIMALCQNFVRLAQNGH